MPTKCKEVEMDEMVKGLKYCRVILLIYKFQDHNFVRLVKKIILNPEKRLNTANSGLQNVGYFDLKYSDML